MVDLLLRRAACHGHWCTWDGASATFSTPGNVLSSRDLHLAVTPWGANTAEREPASTRASRSAHDRDLGALLVVLLGLFLDLVAQKYHVVFERGGLDQLQVLPILEDAPSLAA